MARKYKSTGAGVDWEIVLDDEEVRRMLEDMVRRGTNLSPAMKRCLVVMLKSTHKTFEAEGRPTPWPALSQVTIARRRKGKRGQQRPKPLQDTRRMYGSVSASHHVDGIREITSSSMTMGTRVSYAGAHHKGAAAKSGVKQHVIGHWRPKTRKWIHRADGAKVKRHWVDDFNRTVTLPKVPRRRFLLFQDEDVASMSEVIYEYWAEGEG